MSVLHAYFHLRNQQAFQRALADSANATQNTTNSGPNIDGANSSSGKSWNRPSTLAAAMNSFDVNARDWLGRTVLHLACAAIDPSSAEYARMLLSHPAIHVNLPDRESSWTALHRAMYSGNLAAAVLLLQRSDIDITAKDVEGFTPFDLYNTTLAAAKIRPADRVGADAELFTWGQNRNASLGLADGDDRSFPDQVLIPPKTVTDMDESQRPLAVRFTPVHARKLVMSRLHTAVVTSEASGNLRLCGFASGGRLGQAQHTQYTLAPLPSQHITHTIISVALGQDHTLALTSTGEVLSWGSNRFSQLGYIVEESATPTNAASQKPKSINGTNSSAAVQTTPRKVQGALRKETVRGIAAAKTASACWTATELFTWGLNGGQLGYDKNAQPVQVVPRKATRITQPVLAVALTENAMAVLLASRDVICVWNDRHVKISFPTQAFPSGMQVYRPPQAIKNAHIAKITSASFDASTSSNATATSTFAALSENGELFTFVVGEARSEGDSGSYKETEREKDKGGIKPQRVWALRKQSSAVKDVALGSDGAIIVCTESGHVFVRSRSSGTNSNHTSKSLFKFRRIPYLQRVTNVCANSTGAFGALRVDYHPKEIDIGPSTHSELGIDLGRVRPWLVSERKQLPDDAVKPIKDALRDEDRDDDDEFVESDAIRRDIETLRQLCELLVEDSKARKASGSNGLSEKPIAHGADIMVQVRGGAAFPAHSFVLAARSSVFAGILKSKKSLSKDGLTISVVSNSALPRVAITGCQPLSVLLLLTYIYTDIIPAAWDNRVYGAVSNASFSPTDIRADLQHLSSVLQLPLLAYAVDAHVKRTVEPSLGEDLKRVFNDFQCTSTDVIIQLADKSVRCHSLLLRARSPLLASFFDDPEWTVNRRDLNGVVKIHFEHMKWQAFKFALRFVCFGEGQEMFDVLDFANSVDDVLEFVFEVMSVANELLLSPLVLVCSSVILSYADLHTACYILTEAVHLHALPLASAVMEYMTANLEALLESRMLDDLAPSLLKQLAAFVRSRQLDWAPTVRSSVLVNTAMQRQAEWLETVDIPAVIVPSTNYKRRGKRVSLVADSPGLPPTSSPQRLRRSMSNLKSPQESLPQDNFNFNDDIFAMDDEVDISVPSMEFNPAPSPKATPAWKVVSTAPRVDMKTLMAETERNRVSSSDGPPLRSTPPSSSTPGPNPRTTPTPSLSRASGSPWRVTTTPTASPSAIIGSFPAPSASGSSPRSHSGLSKQQPSQVLRKTSGGDMSASVVQTPGLGPVFSPSRPKQSNNRRVSSGNANSHAKAWNAVSPLPVMTSPTATSGVSLVAIQHEQSSNAAVMTDRRSLRDIQAEEQARREEEVFMQWWAEEESRVRAEEAQILAIQTQSLHSTKGKGKSANPKAHKPSSQSSRKGGGKKLKHGISSTLTTTVGS